MCNPLKGGVFGQGLRDFGLLGQALDRNKSSATSQTGAPEAASAKRRQPSTMLGRSIPATDNLKYYS